MSSACLRWKLSGLKITIGSHPRMCWPQDSADSSSGTSPRQAICMTPASALSLQSTPASGVTRDASGRGSTLSVSWSIWNDHNLDYLNVNQFKLQNHILQIVTFSAHEAVSPDELETQLCPLMMGVEAEVEKAKPNHRRQADKDTGLEIVVRMWWVYNVMWTSLYFFQKQINICIYVEII